MSRAPTRAPARSPRGAAQAAAPHCPENDCQRDQARALTRLADVGEAMHAELLNLKPTIETLGEIAGKWLRFCAFVRKWFPRVGWWLLPIAATVLSKGSSQAVDALIQAATLALQSYAAGAGT